jgi:hypothetical protein
VDFRTIPEGNTIGPLRDRQVTALVVEGVRVTDALVSDELAQKFATEKDSPYVRWVHDEGLDIIAAHYVPDLHTVELKAWPRRGGAGVFINH